LKSLRGPNIRIDRFLEEMSRKLVPQNRKVLSAHQVLLQLEEEKYFDRADIFITPPVNANFTDEDSDDEDAGCDIDHLSKRQLEAEAECTVHSGFEQIRFSSSNNTAHVDRT